jgi:hypothetical protein
VTGADAFIAEIVDRVIEAITDHLPQHDQQPREEPWRLWTVQETADRLGRSTKWVRAKAKAGDLIWVRLDGGALAFEPEDVKAFARARRIDSQERSLRAA